MKMRRHSCDVIVDIVTQYLLLLQISLCLFISLSWLGISAMARLPSCLEIKLLQKHGQKLLGCFAVALPILRQNSDA